jgi:hypothetical protein
MHGEGPKRNVKRAKRNHVGGLKRSGSGERRTHVAKGKRKIVANRKKRHVANGKRRPVANGKRRPVANGKRRPVANERRRLVANRKRRPVANERRRLVANRKRRSVANEKKRLVASKKRSLVANEKTRKKPNEGGKLSLLASRRALSRRLPTLLSLVLNLKQKKPTVASRKKQILPLRGVHKRRVSESTGPLRNGDNKKN